MNNKFKHSLLSKNIVLRQDDATSTFIENNAGSYVPLVRIKDTVIPFSELVSFKLEIGQSFLPQLFVTFNDDDFHYRESDFIETLDTATIFIGSSDDEINEPIKNDYLITSVDASPGSSVVSITAILDVPELYKSQNQYFENISSIQVLEQLAKQCKLGFTTNVDAANDSMTWIQTQNTIDFMHEVCSRAYIDDNSSLQFFVDQFANLTVVNLNSAISGSSSHTLEINPVTGKQLDESIDLLLTMNKLDTDNPAKITSYTPINDYGLNSTKFAKQQNYAVIDHNDYKTIDIVEGSERNDQRVERSMFSSTTSSNSHQKFYVAQAIQSNNRQLIQGTKMSLLIDWSIQSLYMYQVVPVDIYNIAKRTYKESQDETKNLDQLTDEEPQLASNAHTRNDDLSGNCMILEMTFIYIRTSSKNKESRLRQRLKVFKV